MTRTQYTVLGYKGKQVRDNMHSSDLIRAFDRFFQSPKQGVVYNIGGGRFSNCSMLEAISMFDCQTILREIHDQNRERWRGFSQITHA
jgi:CDP-paratose 2-epimerase